jgi:hypothetical protein
MIGINGIAGALSHSPVRLMVYLCLFMDFVTREPFFAVCTIREATIVGLLFRPVRLPEAVWACLRALARILLNQCGPVSLLQRDPVVAAPVCDRRSLERCRITPDRSEWFGTVSRWPVAAGDFDRGFGVALIRI